MRKAKIPVVKRSLPSWVLSSNLKLQGLLLLLIAITVFARVLPLEMQKRIVNEAIRFSQIRLLLIYCGVYLAAGPELSYYEFKHPMSDRLTDEAWREMLKTNPPERPPWVYSYLR